MSLPNQSLRIGEIGTMIYRTDFQKMHKNNELKFKMFLDLDNSIFEKAHFSNKEFIRPTCQKSRHFFFFNF